MKEFEYLSHGVGQIHAYRWEPQGAVRGVVQLVHGIAEHMLRYDDFARFLTSKGLLVVGEDHMGHGKTTGEGTPLYFEGGWSAAVEDTYALLRQTKEEFPSVPYVLFGHSMGSFLSRTLLYRHADAGLSAAVLCGTGWEPAPVLRAGLALCAAEKKRVGAKGHSPLLTKLMFGTYNAKFPEARTPDDWICSRREVVDRYVADPLCGGEVTVGLAQEMLRGIRANQRPENLAAMPKQLDVLFIAGKSDPVGNMGKGVETTVERFRSAGMERVTWKLYEGRHEILNETIRAQVYTDVWNFVRKTQNLT